MTTETHVNERQLDKNAARRLAIIRHAREVTGNVALMPVLRDQPTGLLRLVPPLRNRGTGRAAGPLNTAGALPARDPG